MRSWTPSSSRCCLAAAGTGSFCLWAACVLRATHNGPIPQLEATCSEQRAQHLCGRPDPCQMCWAHCPRSTQLHASSSLSRKSQICVVALICVAFRLAAGPGTHTLLRHNRHSLLYRMPSVPQMESNSLVHPLPKLLEKLVDEALSHGCLSGLKVSTILCQLQTLHVDLDW